MDTEVRRRHSLTAFGRSVVFPPETPEHAAARIQWHVRLASLLSMLVNLALLLALLYSAIVSSSLSVAASALDSFFDLLSQAIVTYAERGSKRVDPAMYPAGRSRLEPIGMICCAGLMGMAALLLIDESSHQLAAGYGSNSTGHAEVNFSPYTLGLLGFNIVSKVALLLYCRAFAAHSAPLQALAEDHRNDIASNCAALAAALVAWRWPEAWLADPIGAIVMSLYICYNWAAIAREQMDMLVGRAADPNFIAELRALSSSFHSLMVTDLIRAYHFGAKYLVELEVVLPSEMTVREAHDIALALQQSVEQLPVVERAFVHVDWRGRDGEDEHNAEAIAEKRKRQRAATPELQGAADVVAATAAATAAAIVNISPDAIA